MVTTTDAYAAGADPTPENMPDWPLLSTWVLIVQTGSLAQTAQRLKISPAAVSQRLKLMEAQLGTELHVRSVRPLVPTAAGAEFYEHASRLLNQARDFRLAMDAFHTTRRRIVRVGTMESFASTLGPALVQGAGEREWPAIRLSSGLAPELEWQMERRMLDFSVTSSPVVGKGVLRKQALFSECFLVALPRRTPVEGRDTLKSLTDTLPMVRYSMRSVMGRDLDAYFSLLGERVPPAYEFEAAGPMLGLVASGLGFAITTGLCLWDVRHLLEHLRVFPLSRLRSSKGVALMPPQRTLYLGYRDSEPPDMRQRVAQVIHAAAVDLIDGEIAAALELATTELWQDHTKAVAG